MLAPPTQKVHIPINSTAIPGIVRTIALNADLVKPDTDNLSGLSSAQD
jgi:hypothetical protein